MSVATPTVQRLRPAEAFGRALPALATACLVVLVACGAEIALSAATPHSPLLVRTPGGDPSWLAGPLSGLGGMHLALSGALLLMAAMGAAYLGLLPLVERIRARWVIAAIAVLHVLFMLAPPLMSNDVFSYIDYARLSVLHGLDPYSHSPSSVPHDAAFAFTRWRHARSVYGPLFTLGSYPLGGLSVSAALWSLKAVGAAASLGCAALVWRIAGQLGRSPVRAAAMFGLNPMLLVWTVGGAHNDLLMLFLALLGVTLVLGRREALGGAAVVAAIAVKASAGIALPFVLLGAQRRWRALAGTAAALAIVAALAVFAFPGQALSVVAALRHQQKFVAFDSVPTEFARLAGLPGVTSAVRLLCTVLAAAAIAWLIWRVWRGAEWVRACGWALVAVVVTTSFLLGWYAVWPLPFAAVTRDRRLLAVTLLLQVYFVVNHIPGFTL
ncbi:MAG: alpha,6-mannosyltransferase [Thermoleophilaceae bacterium]|nr:alpha,6-mannosyltransferase [Thermoleophilaceae bacterium]